MTNENTETSVNPDDLSDEELLAAINADPVESVEELTEQDQEAVEAVAEAEEETEEEEQQAEPAEGVEVAESQEPERSPEDVEREKLLLRLDELELERKHFESVAGSNAGKVGYLERQLKSLSERLEETRSQRPSATEFDGDGTDSAVLRRLEEIERKITAPRTQEADANAIAVAIQTAGQEFQNSILTPEVLEDDAMSKQEKEYIEQAVNEIRAAPPDTSHILQSGDAEYAKAEVVRLLNRAYVKVRRAKIAERRKELEARTVDQAASLKDKKRAASISRSGGKTAAPKKKVLDPATMDLKKLGKLIDSVGGRGR